MSKHNVRSTASGEYECSCGARWDRDEGSRCPATVAVSELPGVALNSTLPEPKEVVGAGDERADFEAFAKRRGLSTVKYPEGMYVCNNTLKAQPSGVVLPERKNSPSHPSGGTFYDPYASGWNACLNEVARLNQPDSAGDDRVREALRECLEVMELHRLTGQVYANGRAALSANHSEKQAKDAPYMSDDADPRETWAQGYNAAMRNA